MFGKILNKASEHGTRLRQSLRKGTNQVMERGNLFGRNVLNFADRQKERFFARNNTRVPPPPSVPTLGTTMRKIQQYEPDVYDEIARVVTGSATRVDPIGKMKPFDNMTLRRAVKEYTTNPIMAIRKYGKISLWDTSQVTNMSLLFQGKVNFNANISAWDVSNVTNMDFMFSHAKSFNQPIGNWDVRNVETMNSMFEGAEKFNQPIGNWDVRNVKYMNFMFEGAEKFNQPIGNWDVRNVIDMHYMFNNSGNSHFRPSWYREI